MRGRLQERYGGQMAVALVIGTCFLLLGLIVVVLAPLGGAVNEKTGSQTAADAAALAGAQVVREQWLLDTAPGTLLYPLAPGAPLPPGVAVATVVPLSGAGAAASYATVNDARLVAYRAIPALGRTYADVENLTTDVEDADVARSEATAEMDIDFTACEWDDPVPELLPPAGPPTFTRTLQCGAWEAPYEIANLPAGPGAVLPPVVEPVPPVVEPVPPEVAPAPVVPLPPVPGPLTGVGYPTLAYDGATLEELSEDLAPRLVD